MDEFKSPIHLRCEYSLNPLGIDEPAPRLSWWVNDVRQGARQTAYQICVGHTPQSDNLWNSGKVVADTSAHIAYEGRLLGSGQRAYWQVRTWDADDQPSPWSEPAWWEMGLLLTKDWKGDWIGFDEPVHPVPGPAIYFRRAFYAGRPIARARLYITARGIYIPYLNGARVGEDRLTPGWTDYAIRNRYQTYDITHALQQGSNVIGAMVSDGWYCGNLMWTDQAKRYGDRPALLAQLHLNYSDGSVEIIGTDQEWKATNHGPVRSASFMHGDTIDAREQFRGNWLSADFDTQGWTPVKVTARDGTALVAQMGPTVQKIDELPAKQCWKLENGNWVFDLGQNMVGVIRLKIRSGCAGQCVTIKHGEMLNGGDDRAVYTANLRKAKAVDTFFTCGNGDEELFEPPFTLHGFRYVEVSGLIEEPSLETVTGVVYHSNLEPTGTFECSDTRLNQLQHNIVWGQKGNFVEIPTDCPQRDERLGWTGDAQVFCRTAAFNMNVAAFFNRWMVDVMDAQRPDGAFTHVVPDVLSPGPGASGSPAWGDAGVIIPWTMYVCYGDRRLLERCYPSTCRFIKYLKNRCDDFVYPDIGYGDWLSIGSDTPKDLIGTAYSAYSVYLMRRIATVLGKEQDAVRFGILFDHFKQAFNQQFVTPAGRVLGHCQTADLLALHFGLVDEPHRASVIAHLCSDIEQKGVLTTGFVGVNLLLPTLTEIGRDDLAYKLLANEKFPSWLFSVNNGATTIWERWDGWTPEKGFQSATMNSFNHYAYGSCGEWMYSRISGIEPDPRRPGYKHVIVRPRPGGGITSASATLDTVHGRIESKWSIRSGNLMSLALTISANMTATVVVPGELQMNDQTMIPAQYASTDNGQTCLNLPAGKYYLEVNIGK